MQRSPPAAVKQNALQGVSEPDLTPTASGVGSNSEATNVSVRSKRPRLNESPENAAVFEVTSGDMSASQNSDAHSLILDGAIISTLRKEIETAMTVHLQASLKSYFENQFLDLKNTLQELKDSVQFMSNDFDDMKSELVKNKDAICHLKKKNEELKSSVSDLSVRLNLVEQHSRQDNIEMNGVPENQAENLVSTVVQLGKTISCNIQANDILSTTRVKKLDLQNNRPRSIIVKLRNARIRDEVLASVTKFNRAHVADKLNSSHLGYGGNKIPVFVSEHLSPLNK